METSQFLAVSIWVTITVKIMIGDFILWIRNVLKQNLFCVRRIYSVMFSDRYEQGMGKLKVMKSESQKSKHTGRKPKFDYKSEDFLFSGGNVCQEGIH